MKNFDDVPYKCNKCTNEKFRTFDADIEDLRSLLKTQSLEIEELKNPTTTKKSKKSAAKPVHDKKSDVSSGSKKSSDSEVVPENPDRPKNYKTKVCKYFASKKLECKRGEDCTFLHPDVCKDHKSKGPHGCKTKNCKKLHPDFCQNSINLMQCLNKDCKLLHIAGTIRKNKPTQNRNLNSGYPAGYYPNYPMNPLPFYGNNYGNNNFSNYGNNFPNMPVQMYPQFNPFLGPMGFVAGAPQNAFPMGMHPPGQRR